MASPETSRSVGTNVCDAIKQEFGDSPSIIRVRNLQHITKGPSNAWGQVGRPQPLLLSAGVYLEDTFGSSAKDDAVKADTVHYGILSKFFLECFEQDAIDSLSLGKLVTALWQKTTGWGPADTIPWVEGLDKPFLDLNRVTMLDLTVNLPKASLLGDGVSFSLTGGFSEGKMRMVAKAVRLLGLRVPTLIGVNPNERLARQVVVTDITVEDMWDGPEIDYVALEAAVVYTLTNSSRETLEALAEDLSNDITMYLRTLTMEDPGKNMWYISIAMEKPIAVPLAGAACVELRASTGYI